MSECYSELVLKPDMEIIKMGSTVAANYKNEMLQAVRNVHHAWLVTRWEGLLALEEYGQTVKNPYFQKFCILVTDAMYPENLKMIMENDIAAEPVPEKKYLAYFYANAFLMIQSGIAWYFFKEYLESLMSPDLREEYQKEALAAWMQNEDYRNKFMEERLEIAEEVLAQVVIPYECELLQACQHKIMILNQCREWQRMDEFIKKAGSLDRQESLVIFLLMCKPEFRNILLNRIPGKERTKIQHRMLDVYENYRLNWMRKETNYFGILERMEQILYEI